MLLAIKFGWPSTMEVSVVTVLVSLSILRNHDEKKQQLSWSHAGATSLFQDLDLDFLKGRLGYDFRF